MTEYLPAGNSFTLVDVGAGAGLLGTYLSRDRPRATYRFIEPIDSLAEMLRGRYGNDADASADVRFEFTDVVTLLDVLEHQEHDHAFMADLVAKMQPGSRLLVTVPALQQLWSPWDVALGHYRRYDKASLRSAIAELPVVVDEVSFLFPEMLPLAHLRARRRSPGTVGSADTAEFPDLPRVANDGLYVLGRGSMAMRKHWRAGTSLFMAARVTEQ